MLETMRRRGCIYSEAAPCDKRADVEDSTYKSGHSTSAVSTQDVEKMVDEQVEPKVASARKQYEVPFLGRRCHQFIICQHPRYYIAAQVPGSSNYGL